MHCRCLSGHRLLLLSPNTEWYYGCWAPVDCCTLGSRTVEPLECESTPGSKLECRSTLGSGFVAQLEYESTLGSKLECGSTLGSGLGEQLEYNSTLGSSTLKQLEYENTPGSEHDCESTLGGGPEDGGGIASPDQSRSVTTRHDHGGVGGAW